MDLNGSELGRVDKDIGAFLLCHERGGQIVVSGLLAVQVFI